MAAVTNLLATPVADTTAATTYTTGSMTPSVGALLVVLTGASGRTVAPTITDSLSGTYTTQDFFLATTSTDVVSIGVADQLASGSALTVSVNWGINATGCIIFVAAVSGMSKTGATAIRKHAGTDNGTAGTAPTATMAGGVLTTNPLLGIAGSASVGYTAPSLWTERGDTSFSTPTFGAEYASRDSGASSGAVTWGATVATVWGCYVIELDASGSAAAVIPDVVMAPPHG